MSHPFHHIRIEPRKGWRHWGLQELWQFRDLLYFMVLRDITVVYKQSILGFAWAIINPVFSMLVFTVIFGRLAGVSSDGIPYPVFSFAALIPWTYFANTLNAAGNSLVNNTALFTKVYFPRVIIPLTPVLSKLSDFGLSFLVFCLLMGYFHFLPGWQVVFLPLLILLMVVTALGMGMFLSALALQYRDVKFALTFVTPLLMYAAPVVFPASLILQKFGPEAYGWYGLYPMAGVIEGFRAALFPGRAMPWPLIGMGSLSALMMLVAGFLYFKKMERHFADLA